MNRLDDQLEEFIVKDPTPGVAEKVLVLCGYCAELFRDGGDELIPTGATRNVDQCEHCSGKLDDRAKVNPHQQP